MSADSKKDDEKTVFDEGGFGIGHNQGPPLDDREIIVAEAEADANADTDTQSLKGQKRGQALTTADRAYLKNLEKTKQLDKVTWDSPYGSEELEARVTALLTGKADGLVSRGGYRRIISDGNKREEVEGDLEKLVELAKQVLHQRNATIFEKHVIGPLRDGKRHPPVEETAAQFNIKPKRVYRIIEDCWEKIRKAIPRFLEGRPPERCDERSLPRAWWRTRVPKLTAKEALAKLTGEEALQAERWTKQEMAEEAMRAKEWQDFVMDALQKWESAYGPKRKPRLSEFFSAPRRKGRK